VAEKILYRGAEAVICLTRYRGRQIVQKRRVKKSYRIKEIDGHLISSRTREEAKLITLARRCGVSVPLISDVDLAAGVITMEYLRGKRIKDILNSLGALERARICRMIGESIARLHNHDIIHGDITTSNMILLDDRIHFIDFGLGSINGEVEAKGVDLHVLMEAFDSTHSQFPDCFSQVFEGYAQHFQGDASAIKKKIDDIVRRGRYR
jgi:Kae1-associated kinase Bud32